METAWIIWLAALCVLAFAGWRASVNKSPRENTFLGWVLIVAIGGAAGFPVVSFLVG